MELNLGDEAFAGLWYKTLFDGLYFRLPIPIRWNKKFGRLTWPSGNLNGAYGFLGAYSAALNRTLEAPLFFPEENTDET